VSVDPDTKDHAARKAPSTSALFGQSLEAYYRQVLDLKLPDRIFGLARRLTLRVRDRNRLP
jgi:hypothetical protein